MKQRVLSANPPSSQHSLPKPRKLNPNTTQYSQTNLRDYSKSSKGKSRPSFIRKSKPYVKAYTKEPQQIMEENLNLKSFINNLQSQLSLQRSRLEMSKKKNEKVTKQINRQFQKQLYYSGKNPSSYLVSGVKSQYQNMKSLYEQKNSELQAILKCTEYTNIEEMQAYIDTLQAQNISLLQQLQDYSSIKNSYAEMYSQDLQVPANPKVYRSYNQRSDKIYTQLSEEKSQNSSKNMEVLMGQLVEEKGNLGRAKTIIERYSQKLDIISNQRDELIKKIEFLEKLIIQKDNNQHDAKRQLKKVERQRYAIQADLLKVSQQLRQNETESKDMIQNLEQRQAKKYEIQRQIFNSSLKDKNEYISKLQKQVRSLSAMLSYWKPLDDNDDPNNSVRQSSPKSKDIKQFTKEERMSNRIRLSSDHFGKESVISEHSASGGEYVLRTNTQLERSLLAYREDDAMFKRAITGNRSNSLQHAINAIKQKPRKQCSKKYNEDAKKSRKVDANEIKQTGELIRYRLIGHNISMEEVRDILTRSVQRGQQQEEYQDGYISMKTLKGLLKRHPFDLNETEATLVSRYIVEDSPNEYVYWDEQNQIYLEVAKSIMRAFVGDYQLSEKEKMLIDWDKIKKVYLINIMTALRTLNPKGKIPLQKFVQLITGLGIEMEDRLRDWILGYLVINSLSLEELSYEVIQKL